ncbi:NusG domain II-containing protein [uncultured Ruminococcus sp.]|uniref:NusG domain II-containing protein n=1 Tax=uncultured Ruminococcus sp. TaxID=165186 RepID=UPI0026238CCA|nr:NusG domain II-containing protein [uncultured Ruminococcus sp.]
MVKRKDLIWAAVFAAVIAACLIFIFLTGGKSGENSAEIYEDGKLVKTIADLDPEKEYSFEIKTKNGTNTVSVGGGSIWVSSADCSNQTCVHAGKISIAGQTVICAPHKLVIKVVGETSADAMT